MKQDEKNLTGAVIAGCEIIREIGRGNSGIVYLAHQLKLDRQVACKVIFPDLQDSDEFLGNLFTEAANVAKLSHPNVIQALSAGSTEEGLNYFLMEYVDGHSLEYIRANTPEIISTDFLLTISIQLADALEYAWKKHRMIHGDIKPGNLLITQGNVLKIADLGLAISALADSGDKGDVMVTPLYTAPEIINGSSSGPDPRSDIYSFGVMFYELACGRAPFTGTVEEILRSHLSETPQPLIVMNPDLDRELAQFIDSTLAKDPADRPADWTTVKNTLTAIREKLRKPRAAADPAAPAIQPEIGSGPVRRKQTSWSAEKSRKGSKFLAKFPWLLPAVLLILIAAALATIPFSMGLFK